MTNNDDIIISKSYWPSGAIVLAGKSEKGVGPMRVGSVSVVTWGKACPKYVHKDIIRVIWGIIIFFVSFLSLFVTFYVILVSFLCFFSHFLSLFMSFLLFLCLFLLFSSLFLHFPPFPANFNPQ